MRDTLHWLPIQRGIFYRVSALVSLCLPGITSVYLQELSPCVDPGWPSSTSFLFWWQTLSSPCKHLDHAVPCTLSCCSFYVAFTSLTDSIATKELHDFALQAAQNRSLSSWLEWEHL